MASPGRSIATSEQGRSLGRESQWQVFEEGGEYTDYTDGGTLTVADAIEAADLETGRESD